MYEEVWPRNEVPVPDAQTSDGDSEVVSDTWHKSSRLFWVPVTSSGDNMLWCCPVTHNRVSPSYVIIHLWCHNILHLSLAARAEDVNTRELDRARETHFLPIFKGKTNNTCQPANTVREKFQTWLGNRVYHERSDFIKAFVLKYVLNCAGVSLYKSLVI